MEQCKSTRRRKFANEFVHCTQRHGEDRYLPHVILSVSHFWYENTRTLLIFTLSILEMLVISSYVQHCPMFNECKMLYNILNLRSYSWIADTADVQTV